MCEKTERTLVSLYEVECRKALWLQAREALWSNCLRTQSSELRFLPCKGPFTHAIFNAIFDAISRTKRALPYPAQKLFSGRIAWNGKKVITYYLKTPFFAISANFAVFFRSVRRLNTRAGQAGAGFVRKSAPKSHEKSHV